MTFYSGLKDTVNFQMYAGRTVGMSFPMDGNKHNDPWHSQSVEAKVNGQAVRIVINTYDDGSLISIEVEDLPFGVTRMTAAD